MEAAVTQWVIVYKRRNCYLSTRCEHNRSFAKLPKSVTWNLMFSRCRLPGISCSRKQVTYKSMFSMCGLPDISCSQDVGYLKSHVLKIWLPGKSWSRISNKIIMWTRICCLPGKREKNKNALIFKIVLKERTEAGDQYFLKKYIFIFLHLPGFPRSRQYCTAWFLSRFNLHVVSINILILL